MILMIQPENKDLNVESASFIEDVLAVDTASNQDISVHVEIQGSKIKKPKISRNTVGILRTTLRNNIDLTNLADNKANVMLSLNALMLTFLVPLLLPHIDLIKEHNLGYPLAVLVITCLYTIYLSVLVLRPGKLKDQEIMIAERVNSSPFFFGTAKNMPKEAYIDHLLAVLNDNEQVSNYMSSDFYHIGHRLAEKMQLIRRAFNAFVIGLLLTFTLTALFVFIH